MLIEVGELLPDLPALNNPGATVANNVIPAANSYRPLPAVQTVGNAAAERIQGAAYMRSIGDVINNFAGSNTNLYKYNSATLNWDDISRTVGGVYTCGSTEAWVFTQYNDLAVAVDGSDVPQKYTMGSSTNFEALGGTPPTPRFVATVRDFIVMGRLTSQSNRVQWSGLGLPESWTVSATTQADFQDIARGGRIMGLVGGEFGIVFQERAINRMTYIGAPIIWQFDEISKDLGCAYENSIASYKGLSFFLAADGLKLLVAGQEVRDVGHQKWDRQLIEEIDSGFPHRVVGAVDPLNSLFALIYPGTGNSGGTPNRILIYNWQIDRAAFGDVTLDWLYTAASQSGFTLDTLDTVSASLDALPASLDSSIWSGSGRLQLAGFDTARKWAFFTGSNLAATVETKEVLPFENSRTKLRGVYPLVDGSSVAINVTPITRNRQNDIPTTGSMVAQNSRGFCPLRINKRYVRLKITTGSGDSWDHLRGVIAGDLDVSQGEVR